MISTDMIDQQLFTNLTPKEGAAISGGIDLKKIDIKGKCIFHRRWGICGDTNFKDKITIGLGFRF